MRIVADSLVDVCIKDLDILEPAQLQDDAETIKDYNEALFKDPVELVSPEAIVNEARVNE